ncbi:MAG: hypothetical protein PHW86_05475 [Candidatus Bipolaricaulis sp.]|nr:hypothetical protein [Candidatus Bipolaricaulis sp.]
MEPGEDDENPTDHQALSDLAATIPMLVICAIPLAVAALCIKVEDRVDWGHDWGQIST